MSTSCKLEECQRAAGPPTLLNSALGENLDDLQLLSKVRCIPPLAQAMGPPLAREQDTPGAGTRYSTTGAGA